MLHHTVEKNKRLRSSPTTLIFFLTLLLIVFEHIQQQKHVTWSHDDWHYRHLQDRGLKCNFEHLCEGFLSRSNNTLVCLIEDSLVHMCENEERCLFCQCVHCDWRATVSSAWVGSYSPMRWRQGYRKWVAWSKSPSRTDKIVMKIYLSSSLHLEEAQSCRCFHLCVQCKPDTAQAIPRCCHIKKWVEMDEIFDLGLKKYWHFSDVILFFIVFLFTVCLDKVEFDVLAALSLILSACAGH